MGPARTHLLAHLRRNVQVVGEFVEAGTPPVELSYDIDSIGTSDFDGTLPKGFTAHPKRDPATGDLHAVNYHWEWSYIQYVRVGPDGRVSKVVDVPVADGPMVHDTAITESQVQRYWRASPPSANGMTSIAFSLSRSVKNSSSSAVGGFSIPAFFSSGIL